MEATIEEAARKWPDRPETIVWQNAGLPWLRDWDLNTAARGLQRALAEAPGDIELLGHASVLARLLGRPEAVIEIGEYVIARDPLCYGCRLALMEAYNTIGRYQRVRQLYLDGRALNIDGTPLRGRYGTALLYEGEPRAALEQFEAVEPWAGAAMRSAFMAMAYHDLGMRAEFEAAVADARELHQGAVGWPEAMVYSYIGELGAAFELLMATLPEDGISGVTPLDGPMGAEMKHHPRWIELAARVGLLHDVRAAIPFEIDLPD
jgi:tetratricopeptide (TPR) repeat protein